MFNKAKLIWKSITDSSTVNDIKNDISLDKFINEKYQNKLKKDSLQLTY